MERDDDIWATMLAWTSERSGVSKADIEKALEYSSQFWITRAGLAEQFMAEDEDLWS